MRYLAPIPSQFLDENGTPYYNGKVYVYIHGDSQLALADIYQNAETDELAENPATLDSHGMWQAFVDSDRSFDYIVKDSDGNVVAQFYDVTFPTGEGVPEIYVESRDGTINVEKSLSEGRQTFNIEVNKDTFKPAYARFTHSTVSGSGTDVELDSFEPDGDGNSDIYLTDGKLTLAKGLYHVSMNMCLGNDSLGNEYLEVIISFGGNELKKVWDGSFIHEESVELGMDISVEEDSSVVLPTINDFPEGMYCSITRLDVHSVGGAGAAGSHSVEHDGTLVGDGTHENPLGVKDYSEIRSDVDAVSESLTRHETANDAHQDIRDELERKEDKDNKVTSWGSTPSDEKYPSEKLVKDTIDNLPPGTAVKGDAESEYRTGNVNLTPANIGAYSKTESDSLLSAKENVINKKQSVDPTSTTDYLSAKAVADFVNSSVATNTANFLGNFSLTDLGLTYPATDVQIAAALNSHTWPSGVTPTNNDYVYVEIQNPQTTGVDDRVERFKFSSLLASWGYEYTLNNSSFTAAEIAAIDSGITAEDVTAYNNHIADTGNPHQVTAAQVGAEPAFSVLPVSKGGTGKTTEKAALNQLTSQMTHYDTQPTDDTLLVQKFGTATDTNGALYTRPYSYLWAYIKSKISSVLGLSESNGVKSYTGNAATASAAASGSALETAINAKLGNTGDASNTTATFTKASGDTSTMTSGGKLSAIFTAISSFFASLKALAFKDKASYNDLSSGVQSSLDKADSALQSHQSVTDNNPTLAWGATSKVGTVGSTDLRVTMPANPAQNLPASVITSGTFGTDRIADGAITANKVKGNETLPVDIRGSASQLSHVTTQNEASTWRQIAKLESSDANRVLAQGFVVAVRERVNDSNYYTGTYIVSCTSKGSDCKILQGNRLANGYDMKFVVAVDSNSITLYANSSSYSPYHVTALFGNPTIAIGNALGSKPAGTDITKTFLLDTSGQVGNSTIPVYVDSNGQVQPCDVLSGGTSNFNRTFTTTFTVGSTDQYITMLIKNDNIDLIADYVAWHNANYGKLSSPPMIIISVFTRDTDVANAGLISLNMYRTGNGCDVFGEKYAYMGNQHGSQAHNTQYFTDQTFVSGSAYYLNIRNETQNTMWAAGTILDISIRIVAHAVSVT